MSWASALRIMLLMNMNEQSSSKTQGQIGPAVYLIAVVVLALLAVSHGVGALKLLKDGEWVWMTLSLGVMGLSATLAEHVHKAYKSAFGR